MTTVKLRTENAFLRKELASVREKLKASEPEFYRQELVRLDAQYGEQLVNLKAQVAENARKIRRLRELINGLKSEADL